MTASQPRQEHPDIVGELNIISCFPVCRQRDTRAWQLVLRPELQQIAKRVARRWRSASIADDDLRQTSLIGLKRAVDAWRFNSSWGEFIEAAEEWVRHELQMLAGKHRVAHVPDGVMRKARKAQLLSRKGMTAEQIADAMGVSENEVGELLIVPLSGGRSELTVAAAGRASFRPDSEDRAVAAIDFKRSGRGLVDICNLGEAQPELPVVAEVLADRQPRAAVKKVKRLAVVEQRQLALV